MWGHENEVYPQKRLIYRDYDNESVDLGIPRSFRQAIIVLIPKLPPSCFNTERLVIHDLMILGTIILEHRKK